MATKTKTEVEHQGLEKPDPMHFRKKKGVIGTKLQIRAFI